MDAAKLKQWICALEGDEIDDALCLAEVIADQDGLPETTLADWRRRIRARQQFLKVDEAAAHD